MEPANENDKVNEEQTRKLRLSAEVLESLKRFVGEVQVHNMVVRRKIGGCASNRRGFRAEARRRVLKALEQSVR